MRTRLLIGLGALTVIALAIGWWALSASHGTADNVSPDHSIAAVGLPSGWSPLPLSTQDQSADVILKAGKAKPSASVVVRRIRGKLTAGVDLGSVGATVEATLRTSVEGFEPIDRSTTRIGGHDAVRLAWRERGRDGGVDRSTLLILTTAKSSYYFTLRAADAEYGAVRDEGELLLGRLARAALAP